jgi:hypothetical protein
MGSEEPVRRDAAVAAAATLGMTWFQRGINNQEHVETYLNSVPSTSMLLGEIVPVSFEVVDSDVG